MQVNEKIGEMKRKGDMDGEMAGSIVDIMGSLVVINARGLHNMV